MRFVKNGIPDFYHPFYNLILAEGIFGVILMFRLRALIFLHYITPAGFKHFFFEKYCPHYITSNIELYYLEFSGWLILLLFRAATS
jgi:hypothetical protein